MWKAVFLGEHQSVVCQEKKMACVHEKNQAGETVSFVMVRVDAGESKTVLIG